MYRILGILLALQCWADEPAPDKCLDIPECRIERLATIAAKIETLKAVYEGEVRACQVQSADTHHPAMDALIGQQNSVRSMICKDAKLNYPENCNVDEHGVATEKKK